jgi:hypothetical protein
VIPKPIPSPDGLKPRDKIPPGRLSDNYRICCFVELILLQEVPAKKANTPSPLTGEGGGEGVNGVISIDSIPLPFNPSSRGSEFSGYLGRLRSRGDCLLGVP